jgi:2-iminobutanoate/2-iminopropanoate deaminase
MHDVVATDKAPKAIGPYSQATAESTAHLGEARFVFCSGQIPLDPATGEVVAGGIAEQTARVLENLKAVLQAAGATLGEIVKTTVYLKDLGEFQAMNEVYARYFPTRPPARATVEVARLPRDVKVEIDCIAMRGK